jgi:hypothetical protein
VWADLLCLHADGRGLPVQHGKRLALPCSLPSGWLWCSLVLSVCLAPTQPRVPSCWILVGLDQGEGLV